MTDEGQAEAGERPHAPVIAWGAPPMPAAPPPVAWAPAPPESSGIAIGPALRDTFARYAADPIRLFLIALTPSILTLVVSTSAGPTLLVAILSIASAAAMMVLGDRGRGSSLRGAIGLGARRIGWVYAVSLIIAVVIGLTAVVPAFLISKVAAGNIGLTLVFGLLLAIPLLWVYSRLILALPAVVIDDIGAGEAIDRARAATKGVSTAVQVFVIIFVAGLASAPVTFAAGVLIGAKLVPSIVVYLVGGALAAFVSPVAPLAYVSMYRRVHPQHEEPLLRRVEPETPAYFAPSTSVQLVAPIGPRGPRSMWDVPAPALGAPAAAAEAAASAEPATAAAGQTPATTAPTERPIPAAVTAPPYGRLARALVGATLTLGIAGVVLSVWTIGALAAGALTATGNVPRGTIVFGPSASIATCTVTTPSADVPKGGKLTWMGSFSHRTVPSDRIRLVISYNGVDAGNVTEPSGTYDCLGSEVPETDLTPGVYKLTLFVNDQPSATGTFTAN